MSQADAAEVREEEQRLVAAGMAADEAKALAREKVKPPRGTGTAVRNRRAQPPRATAARNRRAGTAT